MDPQSSSSEQEDKVQVVWSRLETNEADPAQLLQSLVREELIPGETALMNIVRGGNSKKDADTVCIFCNKTFINKENRKKHTEKCHKGTTDRVIKGKKKKEYVCIRCGKIMSTSAAW